MFCSRRLAPIGIFVCALGLAACGDNDGVPGPSAASDPIDDLPVAFGISALTLLSAFGAWRSWPQLSIPQRAALLIPLVTFPLVYYVVGFEARYRQPMDGLQLLLAATALAAMNPGPTRPAPPSAARRAGP